MTVLVFRGVRGQVAPERPAPTWANWPSVELDGTIDYTRVVDSRKSRAASGSSRWSRGAIVLAASAFQACSAGGSGLPADDQEAGSGSSAQGGGSDLEPLSPPSAGASDSPSTVAPPTPAPEVDVPVLEVPVTDLPLSELPPAPPVADDPVGTGCASAGVSSDIAPVTLLVALDKSNSMGGGAIDRRWVPITLALKAFYADEASRGISASLQLFPPNGLDVTQGQFCVVEAYAEPDVPVTPLPNAELFASLIDATPINGGTPTAAVLSGMIGQAETRLMADPSARLALVLVTDGTPGECGVGPSNSIDGIVGLVGGVADRIPTYAIGVGVGLDDLNRIAAAGGTGSAVLVDVDDPEATRLAVLERLGDIGAEVTSCDVSIPAPPMGRTLEPTKVSAQIRVAGDELVEIPYEADCATGAGWRYDDLDAPSALLLCERACQTVQQSAPGSFEVVFGCVENPQIIR